LEGKGRQGKGERRQEEGRVGRRGGKGQWESILPLI